MLAKLFCFVHMNKVSTHSQGGLDQLHGVRRLQVKHRLRGNFFFLEKKKTDK
jgi:hypothetical protein